jgi:hypothetical protein
MAMKFGGFTPEQMGKIIPEMQGMQADEQAAFLAASPKAASTLGKMAEVAQKKISMAQGGYVQGYQEGGVVEDTEFGINPPPEESTAFKADLDSAQLSYSNAEKTSAEAMAKSQADPSNADLAKAAEDAQNSVNAAQTKMNAADKAFKTIASPSISEYTSEVTNDPGSMIEKADVEKI